MKPELGQEYPKVLSLNVKEAQDTLVDIKYFPFDRGLSIN